MTDAWSEIQGRRLRQLREDRRLSQSDLAKLAGKVHPDSVRHWEKGENHPRRKNLAALADVLKVTTEQLLAPVFVEIPPFPRKGLSLYRVFPLLGRTEHVVEPLWTRLAEEEIDYFTLTAFGINRFWSQFGIEILGTPLTEDHRRGFELATWAKARRRALVLIGFRGMESGWSLADSKAGWDGYLQMVFQAASHCHVILVQAVDPLHCNVTSNRGSWRGLKPHRSEVPLDEDPARFADDLLEELPFCCLATLQDLLRQSAKSKPARRGESASPSPCIPYLQEAGVLCRGEEHRGLCQEAWREPWAKRLLRGR